jgi:hypothetical protein
MLPPPWPLGDQLLKPCITTTLIRKISKATPNSGRTQRVQRTSRTGEFLMASRWASIKSCSEISYSICIDCLYSCVGWLEANDAIECDRNSYQSPHERAQTNAAIRTGVL